MIFPETYLVVGAASTGGYRVSLLGAIPAQQVLMETPRDVVATAKLFNLAVLSPDHDIRALCRSAGVRLLDHEEQI